MKGRMKKGIPVCMAGVPFLYRFQIKDMRGKVNVPVSGNGR